MDDLFAKLEFMNEKPNEEQIKLFREVVCRKSKYNIEPVCKILMTSNPNDETCLHYIENTKSPYQRLRERQTTTDNVDSAYPKYILDLQNRIMTAIPGMTAHRLSGMSAKDFINRRMMVARSKSKRRCAISKLNNKIITLAKRSHHYSDIKTIHDLDGMSRNGKLILLKLLKQNPIYGTMFDKKYPQTWPKDDRL